MDNIQQLSNSHRKPKPSWTLDKFHAKTLHYGAQYIPTYNVLKVLDPHRDWSDCFWPLNLSTDLQLPHHDNNDPNPENTRELSWIRLVPDSVGAHPTLLPEQLTNSKYVSHFFWLTWCDDFHRCACWVGQDQYPCWSVVRRNWTHSERNAPHHLLLWLEGCMVAGSSYFLLPNPQSPTTWTLCICS